MLGSLLQLGHRVEISGVRPGLWYEVLAQFKPDTIAYETIQDIRDRLKIGLEIS